MGDVEVMMEFRGQHWDLWKKFVKDEEDYCNECSEHEDYCSCTDCFCNCCGKEVKKDYQENCPDCGTYLGEEK